jgi:hypothetical protein
MPTLRPPHNFILTTTPPPLMRWIWMGRIRAPSVFHCRSPFLFLHFRIPCRLNSSSYLSASLPASFSPFCTSTHNLVKAVKIHWCMRLRPRMTRTPRLRRRMSVHAAPVVQLDSRAIYTRVLDATTTGTTSTPIVPSRARLTFTNGLRVRPDSRAILHSCARRLDAPYSHFVPPRPRSFAVRRSRLNMVRTAPSVPLPSNS